MSFEDKAKQNARWESAEFILESNLEGSFKSVGTPGQRLHCKPAAASVQSAQSE